MTVNLGVEISLVQGYFRHWIFRNRGQRGSDQILAKLTFTLLRPKSLLKRRVSVRSHLVGPELSMVIVTRTIQFDLMRPAKPSSLFNFRILNICWLEKSISSFSLQKGVHPDVTSNVSLKWPEYWHSKWNATFESLIEGFDFIKSHFRL